MTLMWFSGLRMLIWLGLCHRISLVLLRIVTSVSHNIDFHVLSSDHCVTVYAIEVQYWYAIFPMSGSLMSHSFDRWHCEQYPSSVPLLQEHVMEVWGTIAYAHIGLPIALCLEKTPS